LTQNSEGHKGLKRTLTDICAQKEKNTTIQRQCFIRELTSNWSEAHVTRDSSNPAILAINVQQ